MPVECGRRRREEPLGDQVCQTEVSDTGGQDAPYSGPHPVGLSTSRHIPNVGSTSGPGQSRGGIPASARIVSTTPAPTRDGAYPPSRRRLHVPRQYPLSSL